MKTPSSLSIGELAQQAGITPVTLRYYEKRGLIPPATRTAGQHRQYSTALLPTLRFIQNAQTAGFTLDDIAVLLKLQANPATPSQAIKDFTTAKLQMLYEKIAALQALAQGLESLVNRCPGTVPLSECPILTALHGEKPLHD